MKIPKFLHGDEVRIKQVITNILTNAVKYTEEGSVTLSISNEKVEDEADSIILDVCVTDTGIGIKPEDMKKLFSEFDRIEDTLERLAEFNLPDAERETVNAINAALDDFNFDGIIELLQSKT